jgi:hypothetical protein
MNEQGLGITYRVVSDRPPSLKWGGYATEAEALEQKDRLIERRGPRWQSSRPSTNERLERIGSTTVGDELQLTPGLGHEGTADGWLDVDWRAAWT